MAPENSGLDYEYWLFPRENYERLEEELSNSILKYGVEDHDDGLLYLELRGNVSRSLQEFFVGLHGERLNSRKDLDGVMMAGEFVGAVSLEDLPEEMKSKPAQ